MTVYTEGRHPGEVLLSEAAGQRSRGALTLASGAGKVAAGTVLGRITASGDYLPSAAGASDGSETACAIALYGADATSSAQTIAALVRDAEVKADALSYHSDRDQAAERTAAHADLATFGLIVR